IHRGGDAFPAAQLRDVLLAAQSFQHNADLLFGRILLPRRPADVADKLLGRTSGGNGFLSHLRSLAATMSQKSSVPQATKFVSQALKQDTPNSTVCTEACVSAAKSLIRADSCRQKRRNTRAGVSGKQVENRAAATPIPTRIANDELRNEIAS